MQAIDRLTAVCGPPAFTTSAKSGENVEAAFLQLARKLGERP
jgi:hypothetical protein